MQEDTLRNFAHTDFIEKKENKMQFQDIKNGRFYLGDCLEVMKYIPDGSIDLVLADPPYG